jgi:hypothetical protein
MRSPPYDWKFCWLQDDNSQTPVEVELKQGLFCQEKALNLRYRMSYDDETLSETFFLAVLQCL